MNIVVTTGGSGGHIYPALSIMNRLKELGHSITFIGRKEGLEKKILGDKFTYYDINVIGFKGLSLKSLKAYRMLRSAQKQIQAKFRQRRPDLVIGFGNYVSAPVINAALKLGIPTIIHEQNSEYGRFNLLVKNKVDKVLTSYENTDGIFVGNPRSEEFYKNYQKKFHPGCNVLMFAGSQGSEIFNKFFIENIEKLDKLNCKFHFVTGKKHYEMILREKLEYKNIFIYEYIDNMLEFIADKDICITRAGATTLAELSVIGMPMILVPSPYVVNNHQHKNAKVLEEQEAAILIKESNINTIVEVLDDLIKKDNYLLKRNVKNIAKTNSIELFINEINDLMGV